MPATELTAANLSSLNNQHPEPWYIKPCSINGAAKTGMFHSQYRLYLMLKDLDRLETIGEAISAAAGICLVDNDFYLTHETDPPLDLDDSRVWDMLWKRFDRRYGGLVRREVAKLDIHLSLRLLRSLGPKGRRIVDEDELYISEAGKVRCKEEFAKWNDTDDTHYWEAKLLYFRRAYDRVSREGECWNREDTGLRFEMSPKVTRDKPIEEWLSRLAI